MFGILFLKNYWKDQDVFVLGGGPSLENVDLDPLQDYRVIGCNDAYRYGNSIVDLLFFGDIKWWDYHKSQIGLDFDGLIATNVPEGEYQKVVEVDGVLTLPRTTQGFHRHSIGWNGNTGAAAINLALVMGARRIYLLGFDMQLDEKGRSNWHRNPLDNPTEETYERYMHAISVHLHQIPEKWPGVEIVNLNPQSLLECFPKSTMEEVLAREHQIAG